MIYDCFTLRDELDMLELRLKLLNSKVDYFVIAEANYTHRGVNKPYNYLDNIERFKPYCEKIIYLPVDFVDDVGKIDYLFKNSHKDQSHNSWLLENLQRDYLIKGLGNLEHSDLVILGDLDEIPNPEDINSKLPPSVFVNNFYYYYANNRSVGPQDPLWLGSAVVRGLDILSGGVETMQQLREYRHLLPQIKSGWHFSYFGGEYFIKEKVKSIVEGYSVMNDYNVTIGDVLDNFKNLKDLYSRSDMNFKLVSLEEEYTPEILNILKQYPQFIY